mmetsp:Transcript_36754/g.79631  ORF Transcript_36754/g.79631 Transcript_36754/m.79631 type:complete len:671 (+) Transcript_36754:888-2900(+)
MARLLDGLHEHVESLSVVLNRWSEATFITNVTSILAVLLLDDALEVVVHLGAHDHGLLEGCCSHRQDHELLASQAVARMAATVDDIHSRNRHHEVRRRLSTELRNVLIKGHSAGSSTSSANCHRNCEDGIGTQFRLAPSPVVLGSIQLFDHEFVDAGLVCDIQPDQLRGDDGVDVGDSLQNAFAKQAALVVVSELQSLIDASGGTAGHCCAEKGQLGAEVDFDSGIASRIENLPGGDGDDLAAIALTIVECGHTWQYLALQELQGGSSAGTAVRDLVLGAVLLAGGGGVAASDDSDDTCGCDLDDLVHHALGARLELAHLEDAHGDVPDDGLGLGDCLSVELDALGTAIQSHEAIRNATSLGAFLDLTILAELGGHNVIDGKDQLHTQSTSLLHDVWHDLGTLLIIERIANVHLVNHLQECVGHATTDDHLVDLVQQVHDQLDLVADLRTTKDGQDRSGRLVQDLGEGVQLLGHEAPTALDVEALTDHGTVCPVRGAEGVAAEDVRQLSDGSAEGFHLLLVGFDLVAGQVDTFAFLFHVKSQILKEDHAARGGVGTDLLDLLADAVAAESHGLAELLLEDLGDGGQGVLGNLGAVRAPQVGGQDHRLGALLEHHLDGREGSVDSLGVGDLGGVGLVLGDVEVHTHEDALVLDVDIGDVELLGHGEEAKWK